jgi:hypothetical protein
MKRANYREAYNDRERANLENTIRDLSEHYSMEAIANAMSEVLLTFSKNAKASGYITFASKCFDGAVKASDFADRIARVLD